MGVPRVVSTFTRQPEEPDGIRTSFMCLLPSAPHAKPNLVLFTPPNLFRILICMFKIAGRGGERGLYHRSDIGRRGWGFDHRGYLTSQSESRPR